MTRLAYNLHRVLAGILLVALLFSAANYYSDLGLFGRGAKGVLLLVLFVMVIYGMFFSPTRQDMRDHRDARKSAKNS